MATIATPQPEKTRVRRRWPVMPVARYIALTVLGVVYAMPFIWMLSLSLKPDVDLNLIPPRLIPSTFT